MEPREEYLARIDRVLTYIDANPGGELSLKALAELAAFSPFHFHRVFKAMTGETLHDYTKRMRLKTAAHRLRHEASPKVARVALDLGFESPSDFARSFKAAYGMSPSSFAIGKPLPLGGKAAGGEGLEEYAGAGDSAGRRAVEVIRIPEFSVAYIRCVGLSEKFENRSIEKAFARLFAWVGARDLATPETRVLGVTLDSPETTALSKCRFNACVSVPEGTAGTAGILIGRLGTGGKYARMRFLRTSPGYPKEFFAGVDYLFGSWLPDSGYAPEDSPFLEFYREEEPRSGILFVDFCCPLKAL